MHNCQPFAPYGTRKCSSIAVLRRLRIPRLMTAALIIVATLIRKAPIPVQMPRSIIAVSYAADLDGVRGLVWGQLNRSLTDITSATDAASSRIASQSVV